MPAYKAKYIGEAIQSILDQTYKDFELVIVNDASPEDLDSIIDSFNDNRIRYYKNNENIGGKDLVAQWNKCLSYAQGEFVILATDDDVYLPEYLEKMNVLIDKYPSVDAFRPRIKLINANRKVIAEDDESEELLSQVDFLRLFIPRKINTGIGFWVFRHKKLKEIGGYISLPAAWFSDDIIALELSKNGVAINQSVLYYFRSHEIAISGSVNNAKLLSEKIDAGNLFLQKIAECNFNPYDKEKIQHIIALSKRLLYLTIIHVIYNSSRKAVLYNSKKILWQCTELPLRMRIKLLIRKIMIP